MKNILAENMLRFGTKNLAEAYAWERKEGKPLPTLSEVQAEYEKNLQEDDFGGSYGGNKNRRWSKPSYSRGEWHPQNDSSNGSPIVVTAWDDIVDEYNGKHGYSTSTKSDSRVYESEIGNLSVGMEWKVSFQNNNWRYQLYKLGQLASIFRNLDELISHFKDNNGGNNVTESVITEETEYKVSGRPVTLNKNGSEKQADWSVTFKNGKTAQYHEVASLISPRPKLQPRWWDSDGDGKPYEPGDDVKTESINEAGKSNTFYSRGEWFDKRDDKPSRPKLPAPAEWDKLMDQVNNDPRFETYTGDDGYQIIDTNGRNLKWQLTPGRFGWSGIGRDSVEYPHPRQFNDVAELIKNFYEVTGLSNPDNSDVNLGENMRRFRTKNI